MFGFYNTKSIIIPDITPTKYKIPNMVKFSFFDLFTLNNTNNPIPAFTRSPAIIEPKLIMFCK